MWCLSGDSSKLRDSRRLAPQTINKVRYIQRYVCHVCRQKYLKTQHTFLHTCIESTHCSNDWFRFVSYVFLCSWEGHFDYSWSDVCSGPNSLLLLLTIITRSNVKVKIFQYHDQGHEVGRHYYAWNMSWSKWNIYKFGYFFDRWQTIGDSNGLLWHYRKWDDEILKKQFENLIRFENRINVLL